MKAYAFGVALAMLASFTFLSRMHERYMFSAFLPLLLALSASAPQAGLTVTLTSSNPSVASRWNGASFRSLIEFTVQQ